MTWPEVAALFISCSTVLGILFIMSRYRGQGQGQVGPDFFTLPRPRYDRDFGDLKPRSPEWRTSTYTENRTVQIPTPSSPRRAKGIKPLVTPPPQKKTPPPFDGLNGQKHENL